MSDLIPQASVVRAKSNSDCCNSSKLCPDRGHLPELGPKLSVRPSVSRVSQSVPPGGLVPGSRRCPTLGSISRAEVWLWCPLPSQPCPAPAAPALGWPCRAGDTALQGAGAATRGQHWCSGAATAAPASSLEGMLWESALHPGLAGPAALCSTATLPNPTQRPPCQPRRVGAADL